MRALLPFESPSDFDRGGTRATPADLHGTAAATRPCLACLGTRFTINGTCDACYGTGRQPAQQLCLELQS